MKILYERELELLAQMSLIQRFSLRNELYDKVLEDISVMNRMDVFLRPLFYQTPEKIYNPNKALELQRPVRRKVVEEETEVLDFNEEEWQEELIRKQKEKLKKYKKSISLMLDILYEKENVTLEEMKQIVEEKEEGIGEWIPEINIFKEIMVEFIKAKEINLNALRKERSEYIVEQTLDFQLYEMLLNLTEEDREKSDISKIFVSRKTDSQPIVFENILDEKGNYKTIRCSNIQFLIKK